jgi:hypothetical protein
VTVSNDLRFSFWTGAERPYEGGTLTPLTALGSEAEYVEVRIRLSARLRQTDGIVAPPGFAAAVSEQQQYIVFYGGAIPAGGLVQFVFGVTGDMEAGYSFETIWADVRNRRYKGQDPASFIAEVDESNNDATAQIVVWAPS